MSRLANTLFKVVGDNFSQKEHRLCNFRFLVALLMSDTEIGVELKNKKTMVSDLSLHFNRMKDFLDSTLIFEKRRLLPQDNSLNRH